MKESRPTGNHLHLSNELKKNILIGEANDLLCCVGRGRYNNKIRPFTKLSQGRKRV
ncbi:hypothetical protein MTR_8g005920 [Medicago truncatula]|uniref:Uncharacterized protein n=1 Tax=Medicago truncatula TaxID=3880 RepID=G7LBJ4_MEDTR|nr:hypothetical protein MTR_8g005920 [Medicago truncatula]